LVLLSGAESRAGGSVIATWLMADGSWHMVDGTTIDDSTIGHQPLAISH